MNSIQRLYRISDRKIIEEDLRKNYLGDDIMEAKKKDIIRKVLSDAGMSTNERIIQWVYHSADDLNLYMKMDILDGRDRNIHRLYTADSKYCMTAVPMEDGTHRISIEYNNKDEYKNANTKFGDDELSYINQLVYDIYSGCPRFEWDADWYSHANNAISIINSAKDGVTFRRDIFMCESYGLAFVPIDIINLKVRVDGKIKDKPYITGLLYAKSTDGKPASYKPYALEASIGEVSKQYGNEAVVVPGECISLANMENLFVQIISKDKHMDPLRIAMAKLMEAKMRNTTRSRLEPLITYASIVFVDDVQRSSQSKVHVLPQLLKPTMFETAV